MTRKEQINKRASDFAFEPHDFDEDWYDMRMECFVEGAEWADKTMIEKACKWLETTNLNYYQIIEGVFSTDLVKDFRKAMEKEQ